MCQHMTQDIGVGKVHQCFVVSGAPHIRQIKRNTVTTTVTQQYTITSLSTHKQCTNHVKHAFSTPTDSHVVQHKNELIYSPYK